MKLENLEVGMVLKNYKALCEVLGLEVKTGTSTKQRQMKWVQEHVALEKNKHSFKVTAILKKEVEPIRDNRGGAYNTVDYIKNIEKLILDLLVQTEDNSITLSKNKLLYELQMVNKNYSFCTATDSRLLKLSKFMNINQLNVTEWYNSTSSMLERHLQQALKNLEKQRLIFWTREMTICVVEPQSQTDTGKVKIHREIVESEYDEDVVKYKIDEKLNRVYRKATEDEVEFILNVEIKTMEQLGVEDKQELVRTGLWDEFDKIVKEKIFDRYNIAFYYQSYQIISNREYVKKKWGRLEGLDFSNETRERERELLNEAIKNRILGNTTNRHEDAKKKIGTGGRFERRTHSDYVTDTERLNDKLIDRSNGDKSFIKDVAQTRAR